jgi:hypothetical protein
LTPLLSLKERSKEELAENVVFGGEMGQILPLPFTQNNVKECALKTALSKTQFWTVQRF